MYGWEIGNRHMFLKFGYAVSEGGTCRKTCEGPVATCNMLVKQAKQNYYDMGGMHRGKEISWQKISTEPLPKYETANCRHVSFLGLDQRWGFHVLDADGLCFGFKASPTPAFCAVSAWCGSCRGPEVSKVGQPASGFLLLSLWRSFGCHFASSPFSV